MRSSLPSPLATWTKNAATLSDILTSHMNSTNNEPALIQSPHDRDSNAIGYWVNGQDVQVLFTPSQFYDQLKSNILSAKSRIILSSLYFGPNSDDLTNTIADALHKNQNTHLTVLIDYLRGTRGKMNSVSALLPIMRAFPHRVDFGLYHTPDLSGWKKRLIPSRFNETIGLLHFKIFIADDSVIISGANLSANYFTNRQDRYIQINDAHISNHYARLVMAVSKLSFHVTSESPSTHQLVSPTPCPIRTPQLFKDHASDHLNSVLTVAPTDTSGDTLIVPTFQAFQLGIRYDQCMMEGFWNAIKATTDSCLHFTSGYFNLTPGVSNAMIGLIANGLPVSILTASPQANGFYESKGISKYIPNAYSWLESKFMRKVKSCRATDFFTLSEYLRPTWTFHAKGIWVSGSSCADRPVVPFVTVIGSSNFGYRSTWRDLEAQAIIVTRNPQLQNTLSHEINRLWSFSTPIRLADLDARRVHWLTKVAMSLTKTMF